MRYRIGALTISQSPRYDLLEPMMTLFPEHDIIEAGALDNMDTDNLPNGKDALYPLTTTLNNGNHVTLDRDFLTPLLQEAIHHLEAQDVDIIILLCAGDFPDLVGHVPIVNPTDLAQKLLHAMGINQLAVISPIAIQIPPIKNKWRQAGFHPLVWVMPPKTTAKEQALWIDSQLEAHPEIICIVLDYVGYRRESVLTLQKLVNKPVFDLGHLALSAVSSLL
jgi:protein AroM